MKTLGRLVLLVVALGLVFALTLYEQPIWVQRQHTHLGLFLHRVQSNYVMTPEGRVHYYEAESRIPGGGTPLVLIHGLADQSESFAPMLERLKKRGFHVYAPDLLGYGRSPKRLLTGRAGAVRCGLYSVAGVAEDGYCGVVDGWWNCVEAGA